MTCTPINRHHPLDVKKSFVQKTKPSMKRKRSQSPQSSVSFSSVAMVHPLSSPSLQETHDLWYSAETIAAFRKKTKSCMVQLSSQQTGGPSQIMFGVETVQEYKRRRMLSKQARDTYLKKYSDSSSDEEDIASSYHKQTKLSVLLAQQRGLQHYMAALQVQAEETTPWSRSKNSTDSFSFSCPAPLKTIIAMYLKKI